MYELELFAGAGGGILGGINDVAVRMESLKAIGNGQVPQVVYAMEKILT